ncbi:MAG: hypothetical protein FWE75_13930 [Actinomycetia bacterium]|nr:hypothetical protein [Actinomycetes bacterium]
MRLSRPHRLSRLPLSLPLPLLVAFVLAAVVLLLQASAAALPAGRPSGCDAPTGNASPLTTHIHGGPDRYKAGGADGTWYIDLRNTTAHTCAHIRPVVVLADTERVLMATQPKLEFFEGDRVHPVAFQRTDRSEVVGAFDDGFPGFTVAPGRTLTVKVRLALASDARRNDIVAKAAIVQRRGSNGDWVGESNDYRFRITTRADAADTRKEERKQEVQKEAVPKEKGAGTQSPSPLPSPSASALAATSRRVERGLDPVIGGLLMAAGGVLVAASPFMLSRGRR